MNKKLFSLMLAILMVLSMLPGSVFTQTAQAAGNIIYVSKTGSDSDGSSWASAYNDLQSALDSAGTGDSIYVAAGTYVPTKNAADGATGDGGSDSAFVLKKDVKIYGGFAGNETSLNERDIAQNKTILSGDLGGGNNAYHVVISVGDMGTAAVDGLTITGGNADGSGSIQVGGTAVSRNNGGGMFNIGGSLMIVGCTFTNNTADNGGGIYNINGNLTIIGSRFLNNTAIINGGGLYTEDYTLLVSCVFTGNIAQNRGGGMYHETSTATLVNTIVAGNTSWNGFSERDGYPLTYRYSIIGGIKYDNGNAVVTGMSPSEYVNPDGTLKPTAVHAIGGGSYNAAVNLLGAELAEILYNPASIATESGDKKVDIGAFLHMSHHDGEKIFLVAGQGGVWTDDRTYYTDLQTAMDAAAVWAAVAWEAAHDSAPISVWIAEGSYEPTINAADGSSGDGGRDNAFVLRKDIKVYGGFTGAETDFAQRDLSAGATTTLTGDVYHVVISAGDLGSAVLDGVTVTGGDANGFGDILVNGDYILRDCGGGVYNTGNITVENCVFTDNGADAGGGGIYNDGGFPTVMDCRFTDNTVIFGDGGGMYNMGGVPTITRCVFMENSTPIGIGGGMFNYGSWPKVLFSVFASNQATDGSDVYNMDVDTVTFVGCTFTSNTAASSLYNDQSGATLINTIVQGNVAGDDPAYQYSIAGGKKYGANNADVVATDIDLSTYLNSDGTLKATATHALTGGSYALFKAAIGNDDADAKAFEDLNGNALVYGAAGKERIEVGAYRYDGEIPILEVDLTIAAPVLGQTPQATITPNNLDNFTITDISWVENDDPFNPETVYTVNITLTADSGFTFDGLVSPNATINEEEARISDNPAQTVVLSYTFPRTEKYEITLDQTGTHIFTETPYAQTVPSALMVTVENTGTLATGDLSVTLGGSGGSRFTLSKQTIDSLAVDGTDTFTVVPNDDLIPGTYTATVTVGNSNVYLENQTFTVTFTVIPGVQEALNIIGLGSSYTYGDAVFELSASGGSGSGAVTFVSSDPNVAEIANDTPEAGKATVTVKKAGTFTVTAQKAAADHYAQAEVESSEIMVNKATPALVLTGDNIETNQPIILTATVNKVGIGAIPAGTVTFYYGNEKIAEDVPLVNGVATHTTGVITVGGNYEYTAVYSGQEDYYNTSTDTTTIGVSRSEQIPLSITDPGAVTYGDEPFILAFAGGSGSGAASFEVLGGDVVITIDQTTGEITVLNAGEATIKVTKEGDNTYAPAQDTLVITIAKRDIANVEINVPNTQIYNGTQLQPNFNVSDSDGNREITITSADYTNTYGVNVASGTDAGSITLSGQGNYTGTKTITFDIEKRSLGDAVITLENDAYTYTGNENKPAVTSVVVDGITVDASEFDITYTNNIAAGTATATITAKENGNFSSSASATFTIEKRDLSDAVITLADGPYVYTGSEIKPDIASVVVGGITVDANEFDIVYTNNVNDGTATVTITAKADGNFEGSAGTTFTIDVNFSALDQKITQAHGIGSDPYIISTWDDLQTAIAAAQEIRSKQNVTQAEINDAVTALQTAIDNLRTKGTDQGVTGTTRYTVSFNTNGGSNVPNQTAARNTAISKPANPTKQGSTFVAWHADKDLNDAAYDFDTPVTSSFTLYAQWKADEGSDPGDDKWNNPFIDVGEDDWFYDAIEYVETKDLFLGTSDNTFSPYMDMTRGMLVTVLWRMEGVPNAQTAMTFTDVAEGSYYHEAIAWAAEHGVVLGFCEDVFAPDDLVTREQMAAILHRYLGFIEFDYVVTSEYRIFADEAAIEDYAKPAIQVMNKLGIIIGTGTDAQGNAVINPSADATRAEVAMMLYRFNSMIHG